MVVQMNYDAIKKAGETIPKDQPVMMVNLIKYREKALYTGEHAGKYEECSGKEAYHGRYIPSFGKVTTDIQGVKVVYVGSAHACGLLVGPKDETWDAVVIVEYPSIDTFTKIALGEGYQKEASHHVLAALEDWRLFPTAKIN